MEILADVGIFMFPDNLVRFPNLGVESGPRFLSFPWIGLDRSGTTVRRVTPSTPAMGLSTGVLLNLRNVKAKGRNQNEPEREGRNQRQYP